MAFRSLVRNLQNRILSGSRYFDINLSSHYRPYHGPVRLALAALCFILGLGILWNGGQAVIGYRDVLVLQAELDRVRQQDRQLLGEAAQEGVDLSEESLRLLPTEVALANQLLEKRLFSWTRFLTGLEQALPPRLALSSVRLDVGGTTVRLSGSAMGLEDITAFTVGLQDHPLFKDPVLGQHRSGPNGLVEFDVTLRYRQERT